MSHEIVRPALRCAAAFFVAALTLPLAAERQPAKPQPQPLGPDAVASAIGQIVYQRYCASCHGVAGRGDGAIAKDLKVPPTDLTLLTKTNGGTFPYERVMQIIDGRRSARGHGTPDMPVWGEIFPKTAGTASPSVRSAEVRITHYIWSIQR
jgi:mono/diheme cytochrome c family protein